MGFYRKKPVVIEAEQFTGDNLDAVLDFVGDTATCSEDKNKAKEQGFDILTLEGTHHASVGDFIIKGVHGEFYPCKPDIFEKTYENAQSDKMNFGTAIALLKQGKKVARHGWNGKGMHLWLKSEITIKAEWCKDKVLKDLAEANGGEILGLGTICMYTHDRTGRKAILTGWQASQTDMLSEDWFEA